LTDLYQPKYFELRLREEIEKAKRYRHCLSLMMVEVDNFEEKRYGEEERNKLLKSVSGIARGNLRMGDIACRCEEKGFGIILPEITEEPWGNIRERLKKQIRETVEVGERLRRRVKEEELGVTASIGIANFDGQDREMRRETLIRQAKEALNQAKREGDTVKVFYDEKLRKEISTEVLEWIKETEETLVSGEICVDLVKHTVQVKGKPVKLTPKGFDLLCLLMKKKGRVLNRSFITESIWGYEYFGTTRTVDSHIKTLRQKLGSEGKKIKTIEGIGYKFTDEEI
ncbi:MAG: winged helix-turn-helix domain-containing protein, partial [Elusimicrobiota bacterium]|nr:winged helix-turn-helix domain-containing protein [Elusimicrobiota bacterium]